MSNFSHCYWSTRQKGRNQTASNFLLCLLPEQTRIPCFLASPIIHRAWHWGLSQGSWQARFIKEVGSSAISEALFHFKACPAPFNSQRRRRASEGWLFLRGSSSVLSWADVHFCPRTWAISWQVGGVHQAPSHPGSPSATSRPAVS